MKKGNKNNRFVMQITEQQTAANPRKMYFKAQHERKVQKERRFLLKKEKQQ